MAVRFLLPDVAPDKILDVARLAATKDGQSTGEALDRRAVERLLDTSPEIVRRALVAAEQLGFLAENGGTYRFDGDASIRHAKREELSLFLRKQLISFPPFLIFSAQLTQGFSPQEAAKLTVAVLEIDGAADTALKVLRGWGIAANALEGKGTALRATFEPIKLLELGFLRRLGEALEDAARVRTFVVQEMGADCVADLAKHGLAELPVAIADGLATHESSPRRIGDPVGSLMETYCTTLFTEPVEANSLPDLATKLEQAGLILKSHRNLLLGLTGFRHPASHGPDAKTGKTWTITSKAGLVGNLLALVALRSIYLYRRSGKQEV